ncbi:MAG: epoxyqueuosine reductase QueH [Campylobacterales bacterium]|nr:epoxyqueuosine reductase QueH [Campylobacterales bacterium]
MLVHICCSVDSHFFLEKLQRDYPAEKLTGFFYDPNIHPYGEYRLRLLDVQRSCQKLGIELIEGDYDYTTWLEAVRGLERESEKGERCAVCFDRRFEVSAHKALALGERSFTTTLLVSPLKSQEQLKRSGAEFEAAHSVRFVAPDYRSNGGTQDQSRVTKEQQLYRQDYCGCLFGLSMQRDAQERLMDEMFSPIHGGVLPASIEERLALYERRMELEEQGIAYRIVKEKFLNYRLFTCTLTLGKNSSLSVHALPYSTLPRGRAQGKIEQIINDIGYLNREEVRFITLAHYNTLAGNSFLHVEDLIFHPPTQEQELNVRQKLTCNPYDLTPIMVVDHLFSEACTLTLDAKIYEDTREKLITL